MAKKKEKELVKAEPTKALSPIEEMEGWFEDFFRRPFSLMRPSWFPRLRMPEMEAVTPSVDVFEEKEEVVVKAELPGMRHQYYMKPILVVEKASFMQLNTGRLLKNLIKSFH